MCLIYSACSFHTNRYSLEVNNVKFDVYFVLAEEAYSTSRRKYGPYPMTTCVQLIQKRKVCICVATSHIAHRTS